LEDTGTSAYWKPSGDKWWPGYDGERCTVLEEFSSCFTTSTFLQLLDATPMWVEFKGGHRPFTSQRVLIISNVAPGDQYLGVREKKPEQWRAYMRRVEDSIDCSMLTYDDIYDHVKQFLED